MIAKSVYKRAAFLLLTLCLFSTMLISFPARAQADIGYDLYVGGTQVTERNKGNITGPNIVNSVVFDSNTNTLKLSNAIIAGHAGLYHNAGVYAGPGMRHLTIEFTGENIIISNDDYRSIMPAIYAEGSVTLRGVGSATLHAYGFYADNKPVGRSCYGVCAKNGRLTITSGYVDLWADWTPGANSYGAYAKEIVITGGNVEAGATAGTYKQSEKKYVPQDDGTTKAVTKEKVFVSNGVGLYGAITISGGNVVASGGRFAIGRTPVLKNIEASGSYRTDGKHTRTFIPCDYEQYKYFITSPKSSVSASAASIPKTGDNAPLLPLMGLFALCGAALSVRLLRRKKAAK